MKYVYLVWRSLMRRKVRTAFTFGCIVVSFILFGYLTLVNGAFTAGIEFAGADRLWLYDKVSIIQFVPVSYLQDILKTPGVEAATHCTWFGGSYQDKPSQFATFATDVDEYLKLYPEFKVPPEQLKATLADRQGAIVGRDTANKYGWKIGDRIPIKGDIWMTTDGGAWNFNVDGIYDGPPEADKTQFLFRYEYFDENRRAAKGNVSWYVIKLSDPAQGATVAEALDNHFANSQAETKTQPEKAVVADFAKQTGNIGAMLTAILTVVFFMILLIVANTMAQSVRERTSEIGVLKTLGFSDPTVLALVLSESMVLAVTGGWITLILMYIFANHGSFNLAMLPVFIFKKSSLFVGLGLALLLGVLSGIVPAMAAMRLKITDALRRN
jgi:putative ABC transport system permease protein